MHMRMGPGLLMRCEKAADHGLPASTLADNDALPPNILPGAPLYMNREFVLCNDLAQWLRISCCDLPFELQDVAKFVTSA